MCSCYEYYTDITHLPKGLFHLILPKILWLFFFFPCLNEYFFFPPHIVYLGFKQRILSIMYWESKQLLKGTLVSVSNSLLSSALHLELSYFQKFYITAELTPKKMTYQHTFFFFLLYLNYHDFFSISNNTNFIVYAGGKKPGNILIKLAN